VTDIVVVGYPKSGNTWVTRLVAELVGCPVAGFWNSQRAEVAQEGEGRCSSFRCYKSHHQRHELETTASAASMHIVYVIRDPRDVVVSGAHFFQFDRWPWVGETVRRIPWIRRLYIRYLNPWMTPPRQRMERMISAVLNGDAKLNRWLAVPWAEHAGAYRGGEGLLLRYEDLLEDPERECRRILDYLGLARAPQQISAAIAEQSFAARKQDFLEKRQTAKAQFLRAGAKMQWLVELTASQRARFDAVLARELKQWGYPLSREVEVASGVRAEAEGSKFSNC